MLVLKIPPYNTFLFFHRWPGRLWLILARGSSLLPHPQIIAQKPNGPSVLKISQKLLQESACLGPALEVHTCSWRVWWRLMCAFGMSHQKWLLFPLLLYVDIKILYKTQTFPGLKLMYESSCSGILFISPFLWVTKNKNHKFLSIKCTGSNMPL